MNITPEDIIFRVSALGKHLSVASSFRQGSDELVLFLHGFGCSKELFHEAWHGHSLTDYSMLCLDFIGFGDSDKPEDFPYSLESHAVVLEEVLRQVGSTTLHVVAHSMGAAIVLLLPRERIDRLSSFANVEGNLSSIPAAASKSREPSVPGNRKDLALFQQAQCSASKVALRQSGESLTKWTASGELLKRFQQARCRKAYFYGDDKGELRLKTELHDCNPIQISNAGHFVMNDNPAAFYTKLSAFIGAKRDTPGANRIRGAGVPPPDL